MQTLRIEVSNSIYEYIIFFLQSLPKNSINIYVDEDNTNQHKVDEFRALSRHISVIDKDIDILSLDKDINSDIF